MDKTPAHTRRLSPRRRGDMFMSILIGFGAWEALGRVLAFPFFPPFSAVFHTSIDLLASGEILGSLAASLASLATGYGLAVFFGVLLGTLMGRYSKVEYFFDIYIQAFLSAPTLIWVPILFALFGVSRTSQIAVVFIYSFFVITTSTMAGIRKVNRDWIEMAQSLGANDRQLFWFVLIPGSLPLILAGLRIGIARAVKGMVNGEMFIALVGLGALIRRYGSRFEAEKVLGVLLIVVVVALAATSMFSVYERRMLAWTQTGKHFR